MADHIELRGLRVAAVVGALPEERDRPQPLEIDIDIEVDLAAAEASDDLTDTVDYGRACAVAVGETGSRPVLLEHLAGRIAGAVLNLDERVTAVEVAIRKLRPPVPQQLDTAGVRIRRHRRSG